MSSMLHKVNTICHTCAVLTQAFCAEFASTCRAAPVQLADTQASARHPAACSMRYGVCSQEAPYFLTASCQLVLTMQLQYYVLTCFFCAFSSTLSFSVHMLSMEMLLRRPTSDVQARCRTDGCSAAGCHQPAKDAATGGAAPC
jgi:hypothetical protein